MQSKNLQFSVKIMINKYIIIYYKLKVFLKRLFETIYRLRTLKILWYGVSQQWCSMTK